MKFMEIERPMAISIMAIALIIIPLYLSDVIMVIKGRTILKIHLES
jgi:uncharacterized membrane protein YobD (UPF0266 family)